MDYKVVHYLVQKFRSQRTSKSHLMSKDWSLVASKDPFPSNLTEALPSENTTGGRRENPDIQESDKSIRDGQDLFNIESNHSKANKAFHEDDVGGQERSDDKDDNVDAESLAKQMSGLLARLDRLERRLLQVTRIQSLNNLIDQLHTAFDGDSMDVAHVQCLMEDYVSNVDDWKRFAKFNKDRYTRNLVDEGNGKFNLILLCWSQGQMSSVHDHAQSHCFMKMLQGSLTEVRYEEPKQTSSESANLRPLSEICRTELNENDVCYINDSIGLHKVGNAGPHPAAVSLHLYSPPFDMCSSFDPQTGQKSLVQMSFWSKFGEEL